MSMYRELYRAEALHVFQNRMYNSAEDARNCSRGDVVLVQDNATGLISNVAFQPDLVQYDKDYQNEQAVSVVFQKHLEDVSQIISRHAKNSSLVELGCGKGYFLEVMASKGYEIFGYDPTYEGSNPRIRRRLFDGSDAVRVDMVILRNVLEHIKNPVEFLKLIKEAAGGRGTIYIEVPCLDWILSHNAWYDIFYEHVNYFRLSDFHRIFGRVLESGRIFGQHYLYVIADISSLREPVADEGTFVDFPKGFLSSTAIGEDSDDGRPTVIWGGASKGVIFALMRERAGLKPSMIVDINPAKQGRFVAATGLEVHSPKQMMDLVPVGSRIFVMNSNCLEEIKAMTGNSFNYVRID